MTTTDLIDMYVDNLAERGCTLATLEGYRKNLGRADRELPVGLDIATADELHTWLWRNRDLAPASRAAYYSALAGFFAWALEADKLTLNPMLLLKRPKVPDGMPRAALDEQVRWALHETPHPLKLWAILAAFAGLRCIEISRLHRDHITEEAIRVVRGKGDKPRSIPTHPIIWATTRELPAGPLTDLTPKQISTRFLQYAQRCGLREFSMHRIRGWHATVSYEVENDLIAVSRNLGHSKLDTTGRYIRRTKGQLRAILVGLPTFGLAAES